MPVTKLLVEGKVDVEVLGSILAGDPLVVRAGTKHSLAPKVQDERSRERANARTCYLRDRDFDFDPPEDTAAPTVDRLRDGSVLGWRWCRHEIESYLIDPAVLEAALGWPREGIEAALRAAARRIVPYAASRWTVGKVRRGLPPNYALDTRPLTLKNKDFSLPQDVDEPTVSQWALDAIATFRGPVVEATAPDAVRQGLGEMERALEEKAEDVSALLLWFPGKDLLAALGPWLLERGMAAPGDLQALVRTWIQRNPAPTLELLPEWRALLEMLRS